MTTFSSWKTIAIWEAVLLCLCSSYITQSMHEEKEQEGDVEEEE